MSVGSRLRACSSGTARRLSTIKPRRKGLGHPSLARNGLGHRSLSAPPCRLSWGRWPSGSGPRATTTRSGGAPSTRRSSPPARCSPTTPSASPPWRSTTPSTACPAPRPSPGWDARDAAGVPLHAQGPAAHHPLRAAPRRGRPAPVLLRHRRARSGDKLGPLLFQLPPNFKKDTRAARTTSWPCCPPACIRAFEFRHESWLADDVYERLRGGRGALCVADTRRVADAARGDRGLGLLPAAGRGLHAGGHRALGAARSAS